MATRTSTPPGGVCGVWTPQVDPYRYVWSVGRTRQVEEDLKCSKVQELGHSLINVKHHGGFFIYIELVLLTNHSLCGIVRADLKVQELGHNLIDVKHHRGFFIHRISLSTNQ